MEVKKFKIGDRVEVISNNNCSDLPKISDVGTIINIDDSSVPYLVEFDTERIGYHDGQNFGTVKGKQGRCYWCREGILKLYSVKFNVGDRVRIKSWEKMEKEFGLNYHGSIKCISSFISAMKHLCGKTATITRINDVAVRLDFDNVDGDTCWSYSTDMIELANDEKIVIIRHNNKVIAKNVTTGKEAVAKCSPGDEFDFETGAKLALKRLFKKKLVLKCNGSNYGTVGTETILRDINGEKLFVGDTIETFNRDMQSYGENFICNEESGGDFVMGIAHSSSSKYNHGNIADGWKVIKRASYTDLKAGDKVGRVTVVEE